MFVTGRFALLVALGAIPVVIWPSGWTVVAWAAGAFFVMLCDVVLAGPTTAVAVSRAKTAPIRLGEHTTTQLSVVNSSRRRYRGRLRDAWQPSAGAGADSRDRRPVREPGFYTDLARRWEELRLQVSGDPAPPGPLSNRRDLNLAPEERQSFDVGLQPTRRGDRLAIRLTLRRNGPLGLAGRQRSLFLPGAVRALPAFDSRKHLPSRLASLRQLDGRSAVRTRGQGTEFDSLRDYVEGDDVRSIDWRATARRRSVEERDVISSRRRTRRQRVKSSPVTKPSWLKSARISPSSNAATYSSKSSPLRKSSQLKSAGQRMILPVPDVAVEPQALVMTQSNAPTEQFMALRSVRVLVPVPEKPDCSPFS